MGRRRTIVLPQPDPVQIAQMQLAQAQPLIQMYQERILGELPRVRQAMIRRMAMGVPTLEAGFVPRRLGELGGAIMEQLAGLRQAQTAEMAQALGGGILGGLASAQQLAQAYFPAMQELQAMQHQALLQALYQLGRRER